MFEIVLLHPEVPAHMDNAIRLASNAGARLHIIDPVGFSLDEHIRHMGVHPQDAGRLLRHASWGEFLVTQQPDSQRMFALSPEGGQSVFEVAFAPGDWLIFGTEQQGLPPYLRGSFPPERSLRLPMVPGPRSLSLSNAVAITVYEGWRQNGFAQRLG